MYDTARAECGDAICREFSTLQYQSYSLMMVYIFSISLVTCP